MIFYHGTSLENYNRILEEGILFGVRHVYNSKGEICNTYTPSRCTYLALDKDEAKMYGEIVLEVEYNVNKNPGMNNYAKDCWQIRVYEPIPLKYLKNITDKDQFLNNLLIRKFIRTFA